MKIKILITAFIITCFSIQSQSYEHKWNVGLHGGCMQYMGDLGSGFYRFDRAFYGNGGISVSRYLNRRWDASLFATRGVVGFLGPWNPDPAVATHFLTNITTVNLLARYNFMHPESFMRPYICFGAGMLKHDLMDDSYFVRDNKFDYAIPEIGAGINFHFGKYLGMQIQELLMYNSSDEIDRTTGGINDMYLLHTIGLTCNLGSLGKLAGPEKSGPGGDIDKCPRIKQHRNKVTKSEGRARSKPKKSRMTTNRSEREGFWARLFKRKKKTRD